MQISKYSKIIIEAAKKYGIKASPIGLGGKMFMLQRGKKHTFIYQSLTELVSNPMYRITSNKFLTQFFLKKKGFPVPQFALIENLSQAKNFLRKHKKIVIKPLSANQGKGITIGIKKQEELEPAIKSALKKTKKKKLESAYKKAVMAERAVSGDDHRLLVIGYKQVFAIKKIPAYIIGSGRETIKQLIEKKNSEKLVHKKPIKIDNQLRHVLKRQNFTLRSVPKENQQVFVRRTANLATGGESIDITDKLNKRIKKTAIEAAKALKMPVAGFDFMCRDYTDDKGYFIEVNPIPGLLIHHHPHRGKERKPAQAIVKLLIKQKLI